METLLTSHLANGVKVTVHASGTGFRSQVIAPDVYTGQSIVHSAGRKAPYKSAQAALTAGLKDAHENYAHIIDPEAYWA